METANIIQHLIDPEKLIHTGGLILVLLIIFIENGLFFGFFLPGDTLLFTAGLLCATGKFDVPISSLLITIFIASILGNAFGYYFGRKVGRKIYQRPESLLFKKKYIEAAEIFFNKYGGMALILGRFLPIIRTFAPIFAGIVEFDLKKFIFYNISGGFLWVFSMTLAGYYLGIIFPSLNEHIEWAIIGIVIITWVPVITTYLKEQNKKRKKNI
ncbi:MAG: DedA family protein [Cytophagales bacterium]|nr:MAG: DedA family protein [Cytophagales bacterium]